MNKRRVCHITTVHPAIDNRIFYKECVSLSECYEVSLIATGPHPHEPGSVTVHCLRNEKSRIRRLIFNGARALRLTYKSKADIFHFHDPELIWLGLLLRALGKPVIYDVHEDYVTSILQRPYLPRGLRKGISMAFSAIENAVSPVFTLVLAERYYKKRFPKGVEILNYPIIEKAPKIAPAYSAESRDLIYTGNITEDRGALLHTALLKYHPEIRVHMIGMCSDETHHKMLDLLTEEERRRLLVYSVENFVPPDEIRRSYGERKWLGALAIFPATPHYFQKELTKFFEYMQAGIPIVCSNFPRWDQLVQSAGAGICVSPEAPQEWVQAIDRLISHPEDGEEIARKGQDLVSNRYNWDVEAKKLKLVYETLLGSG